MASKYRDDTEQRSLDDRLDEVPDESFPASDPPAVHPRYAAPGGGRPPIPLSGTAPALTKIEFEQGAISFDAALVAEDLRLTPELVLARIREGKITSLCERGLDEDTGRFRLTFFHGNRRVRLVVDEEGKVLERSSAKFHERPPSTSETGL